MPHQFGKNWTLGYNGLSGKHVESQSLDFLFLRALRFYASGALFTVAALSGQESKVCVLKRLLSRCSPKMLSVRCKKIMTNQETYLTPEGFEKLEAELDHLKTVRRAEVAAAIHEAKMDGDVSENAGYEEAKRQQAFLEGRIMTVEAMLKSAVIIETNGRSDTVILGAQVTVVEDGLDPETYTIVGSPEADPGVGRISNESPLGKALMGQKAGVKVTYESPSGQIEMEILRIE